MSKMTEDEFVENLNALLHRLPPEFHDAVGFLAFDQNHSGGFVEFLDIVRQTVSLLEPCIVNYRRRIIADEMSV